MSNDLKDKNSEAYKAKLKIAMKAFEKGCFIHSKETQKLYTPREFMESDERVEIKMYALQEYSNMNLLYPDYLVKSKLEALQKAQKDYNDFMAKVVDSFTLSPREPLKKRK